MKHVILAKNLVRRTFARISTGRMNKTCGPCVAVCQPLVQIGTVVVTDETQQKDE